jgi:hypothetical protein
VVVYSLMTTTPFVAKHSAWPETAFLLGLMTDAAFVMALQADSVLARYGVKEQGGWPRTFRWFTGLATVFLNTWGSVQKQDWTGVAVHLIGPALLLIVAEVAPVYRRAMAEALKQAEQEAAGTLAVVEVNTPPVHPVHQEVITPYTEPTTAQHTPSTQAVEPGPVEESQQVTPEYTPAVVELEPVEQVDVSAAEEVQDRLSAKEARKAIEQAWAEGLSTRDAAKLSTRSPSYVAKVYASLGERPTARKLTAVK